jgi:glutamine amidotransferase
LDLVKGKVVHLKNKNCDGKIPHVGFNTIQSSDSHIFLESMLGDDFYFVHSYALSADCGKIKTATCNYRGATIIAALQYGSIFGSQFHPEKSGLKGLELIRRAYTC